MLGVYRIVWLFLVIGLTPATTHNAGWNQTIQDLENRTAEQIQEYAELKQEMAQQNQTINDMEKAMACFSLVMTQSLAQNALLNQKIRYLDNVKIEMAKQNQTSNDMEKEMAEQNQTITGMEKEMVELKEEMAKQKQEVAKQKQEMAKQKQEMAKQKQEMAKQKQEMAKQKQEMAKQKQEMAKQKQEVADQAQKMAKQNQEVTGLKQKMAKQNQEVTGLKKKQSTAVMFSASLSGHVTISPGKVVVFSQVITNVGHSYNQATGVFTCKVPGYYVFDVTVLGQHDKIAFVLIRRNGVALVKAYAAGNMSFQTGSAHVGVVLHQGDKVDVTGTYTTSHLFGGSLGTFSGHLVTAL